MMNRLWVNNTALRKSLYVIGKAGSGKTNLINWVVAQRMWGKQGVTQIEPHGDSVSENLGRCPPLAVERDKVIYFDPSEEDCPAFNIFALPSPPDKLARDIVTFFRKRAEAWGPRLDQIFLHTNYLLVCDTRDNNVPHAFCDTYRVLTDEAYRKPIVARTKRASEAVFWGEGGEFSTLPKGATAPVLNKLGQLFLSGSLTERIFSQTENDINLPDILDGKIFLVNLSRGKLGEDTSSFLGALISEGLTTAAFARAYQPEHERKWHTIVADEFQTFQSSSIGEVTSQARKFALSLCVSHQYISQLDGELQDAIFANVNAICCFRVDERDAQVMTKKMQRTREWIRERGQGARHSFAAEREHVIATLQKAYLDYDGRQTEASLQGGDTLTLRLIRNDVYAALISVMSRHCTPEALKEVIHHEFGGKEKDGGVRLFGDAAFTSEPYPSVSDLVNLPPFTAFLRVDKTSNVKKFRTFPCPPPDPAVAEAIKKKNRERYEERKKKRAAEQKPYEVSEPPLETANGKTRTPKKSKPLPEDPEEPENYWQR